MYHERKYGKMRKEVFLQCVSKVYYKKALKSTKFQTKFENYTQMVENRPKSDCKCTFQAINQHRLKHEVSWNQKSCFSMYGQKLVRLSHLASETSYSVETQAKGRGRNLQQFIFKGLMLTFHGKT